MRNAKCDRRIIMQLPTVARIWEHNLETASVRIQS